MGTPTSPGLNDLVIDASALDFLEDLPEGSLRGFLSEGDGLVEVLQQILDNQPELGGSARISGEDINRLQEVSKKIAQIDLFLPTVLKLAERLRETRAKLTDQREREVRGIWRLVTEHDKRSGGRSFIARYDKVHSYVTASARKGLQTRRKNAALPTQE